MKEFRLAGWFVTVSFLACVATPRRGEAAPSGEENLSVSSIIVLMDGGHWELYEPVSGMGIDLEDITYQSDKNQVQNRLGRANAWDITLVHRFKIDKEIEKWMKEIKSGKQTRNSGSFIIIDNEEKEIMRFNFFGAWPKSRSGSNLRKEK